MDRKLDFVINKAAEIADRTDESKREIIKALKIFRSKFNAELVIENRHVERFERANCEWLTGKISVPCCPERPRGRPLKPFEECYENTQRRKSGELRESVPQSQLERARKTFPVSTSSCEVAVSKELRKLTPQEALAPYSYRSESYDSSLQRHAPRFTGNIALLYSGAARETKVLPKTRNVLRHETLRPD